MLKWSWIILILFISCNGIKNKEVVTKSFVEKSLLKDSVSINLPIFDHGLPFRENDSTEYLNIYLINDSVVQVNKEKFFLKKGIIKFKDFIVDSNRLIVKPVEDFLQNIGNIESKSINFFIDSTISFGLLNKLYKILTIGHNNRNCMINIFDRNNNYLQIINTNLYTCCTPPPPISATNLLEIKINSNDKLMIEGEWDKSFSDIPIKVKEWYTNPKNDEILPKIIEINAADCKNEIIRIKEMIKSQDKKGITSSSLLSWKRRIEKRLATTKIIGNYKRIALSSTIFIKADKKVLSLNYLKVMDKINKGLIELRSEFCLDKFNIEYTKLNLNFRKEVRIKKAIDEVFPVTLISTYFSQPPLPPKK